MVNPSLLDRLAGLDTSSVSEALDLLQLAGATFGIQPIWDSPRVVGLATTIQFDPADGGNRSSRSVAELINGIATDDRLLVISGNGNDRSYWNRILANAAVEKKVRGTVIDGRCRDLEAIEAIRYPVFARGVTTAGISARDVCLRLGQPVVFAGVIVRHDDYVIADRCGTVFIPSAHAERVIAIGEQIIQHQDAMVVTTRAGRSLSEFIQEQDFEAVNTGELK